MDIDRDGIQDVYALVSSQDASGVAGMDFIAWGVGDGTFIADTDTVPRTGATRRASTSSGSTGTKTAGKTSTL